MKSSIPQTDSIEELAAFWDTHDLTDHETELEEVSSPFTRAEAVRVPLTAAEHDALREAAKRSGLDEAALVHEWVREKLHQ